MATILPFGPARKPHERYLIEALKVPFGGEDSAFCVTFEPPIEVRGMDLTRDGSVKSLGRLAACHIMGDNAPASLSELPYSQRLIYAREIEGQFNDSLGSEFDDAAHCAGAIYGEFLRIGVRAVVAQPDAFMESPDVSGS